MQNEQSNGNGSVQFNAIASLKDLLTEVVRTGNQCNIPHEPVGDENRAVITSARAAEAMVEKFAGLGERRNQKFVLFAQADEAAVREAAASAIQKGDITFFGKREHGREISQCAIVPVIVEKPKAVTAQTPQSSRKTHRETAIVAVPATA